MARRNQLKPTLGLNLSQRLAMTPSLLQKIELLTLNRLELSDLINEELAQNPVLEEATDEPDAENEPAAEAEESGDEYDNIDYDYFFEEYLNPQPLNGEWEANSDRPTFELFLSQTSSLIDHLNWQLNLSEVAEELSEIAYFIIGNINKDGYLQVRVEEIAERLDAPIGQVEVALKVVQSFDPLGVASRDLCECLLTQIRAAGLEGSLVERIVAGHLPLVEARKFEDLARELDCDLEEVSEALEVLRSFSPRPGQKYSARDSVYIEPDVYISKVSAEYQIIMNDDNLPRLRLSKAYRALLKKEGVNKETKSFIKERFRAAIELLRSLDQREQTIYRVCKAIVARQTEFLDSGIMHLKPMLIKDVADELEVHSSTISRVVANKYAHTPQGVLELRKFFTIGIESADGGNISVVHVKEKIKKIVEMENPQKPLSDQKIANLLNSDGIQITRRTVAKYRDQIKIPGSRERKATRMAS